MEAANESRGLSAGDRRKVAQNQNLERKKKEREEREERILSGKKKADKKKEGVRQAREISRLPKGLNDAADLGKNLSIRKPR